MIRSLYKPYHKILLKLAATSKVLEDHIEQPTAVHTSVNRPLSKLYCSGKLLRRCNARILMYYLVHSGSALRASLHSALCSEFRKRSHENSNTASTKSCTAPLECRKKSNQAGFTLIEVLVALSIIAIAFTALLKATSDSIAMHQKLKNKMIREWVAAQGITLIQLGLVQSINNQIISEQTTLFNQHWYWRASLSPTPLKEVQKITLTSSLTPTGPFTDAVVAFKLRTSE